MKNDNYRLTEQKIYHYHRSPAAYLVKIIGTPFLLLGLIILPLLLIGLSKDIYRLVWFQEMFIWSHIVVYFFMFFCLFLGLSLTNMFPSLATDAKGLYVKIFFIWFFVPWENVITFRESLLSVLNPVTFKVGYFVQVKRGLTPFHWYFSLCEFSLKGPGIWVSRDVTNFHEFARAIKAHTDPDYIRLITKI